MENKTIISNIVAILKEVYEDDRQNTNDVVVSSSSPIVGPQAIISSRGLVEVMLLVEEYAEDELGIEFNWQNDATLSERRSVFKTPQTLAEHLILLKREAA